MPYFMSCSSNSSIKEYRNVHWPLLPSPRYTCHATKVYFIITGETVKILYGTMSLTTSACTPLYVTVAGHY